MALDLILVVSVQHLSSHILPNAILDVLITLDTQLQSIENFIPGRLKIDFGALYNTLELAFKKVFIGCLRVSILHLLLKLVAENAVELIDVLLLVPLIVRPTKCLE